MDMPAAAMVGAVVEQVSEAGASTKPKAGLEGKVGLKDGLVEDIAEDSSSSDADSNALKFKAKSICAEVGPFDSLSHVSHSLSRFLEAGNANRGQQYIDSV